MNMVFLDIETAPIGWETVRDAGLRVPVQVVQSVAAETMTEAPPANYVHEDAIRRWRQRRQSTVSARAEKLWHGGSLDPKHGKIVCVSMAVNWEDPVVLWAPSEKDTLRQLETTICHVPDPVIVSHGGRRFDWPFIWERSTGYGMGRLAARFYEAPYAVRRMLGVADPKLIDTRDVWNTTSASSRSLLKICAASGICADAADVIDGSQVLDALLDHRNDEVRVHAYWDVRRLQALWYNHLAPSIYGPEYTHKETP